MHDSFFLASLTICSNLPSSKCIKLPGRKMQVEHIARQTCTLPSRKGLRDLDNESLLDIFILRSKHSIFSTHFQNKLSRQSWILAHHFLSGHTAHKNIICRL